MLPFIKNQIENYSVLEHSVEVAKRNPIVLVGNTLLLHSVVNGERKQHKLEHRELAELLLRFDMIDIIRGYGRETKMYKKYFLTTTRGKGKMVMHQRDFEVKLEHIVFDDLSLHGMCVYLESKRISKIIRMFPRKAA